MKKIITIIGPTATGKTSLAIQLAKLIDGEVIGLDSRQIYKGMPIGTAQPIKTEMKGVYHHLLGFQDPSHPISAGQYSKMVREKVKNIKARDKMPIICGGSGLYYRALTKGIFKESITDLPTRLRLEKLYKKDPDRLYKRLQSIDPEYASIVHINNKNRLIRAIEIYETTGKSPTEHFINQKINPAETLDLFTILLRWERSLLNQRISFRTKLMLNNGWIKEVKTLLNKQSDNEIFFPAFNSIGYSQIQAYLNGKIDRKEMEKKIVIKTRQFARRQIKWFNKETIDLIIEMDHIDHNIIPKILHCIFKDIS